MKKRIGYGQQAETPKQPKAKAVREPRLRNQLNKGTESFIRDAEGNCFKAVMAGESFTWVEIEAAEFEAANDSRS
jgi:hypothetical protein